MTGIGLFLAGLLAGLCGAGFIWLQYGRQRRELKKLNGEIDRILHGDTGLELSYFREGQVEILRDEIYKMTIRLREQAEKLEADKRELAEALADISHQIRTPLTALNLMNARLSSGTLTEEERREILRNMKKMMERIEWLITALLKMSKLEAGMISFNIEEISVKELAQASVEPFLLAAELRQVDIQLKGDEGVVFSGDRMWTREAVENVMKNCLEYTPKGGHIRICWDENPLYVRIMVKDDGPGISPEDIPHLFERFYRGKGAREGSFGIGLALAQMIVNREKGVIRTKNSGQGGSCFEIRFYKGCV